MVLSEVFGGFEGDVIPSMFTLYALLPTSDATALG